MTTTLFTFNVLTQDPEGFKEKHTVQAADQAQADTLADALADDLFVRVLSVRPR